MLRPGLRHPEVLTARPLKIGRAANHHSSLNELLNFGGVRFFLEVNEKFGCICALSFEIQSLLKAPNDLDIEIHRLYIPYTLLISIVGSLETVFWKSKIFYN